MTASYTAVQLRRLLDDWGHLRVTLRSGQEFWLGIADTEIDPEDGMITVDSKRGLWHFPVGSVDAVAVAASGPVS